MGAIDDLKGHVVRLEGHLTQRLEGMERAFVPRGEYEARHSDVRNQITKLDARLDADIARQDACVRAEATERKALEEKLRTERAALEDKLSQQRRYALTTSIGALGIIVALLSVILANLP